MLRSPQNYAANLLRVRAQITAAAKKTGRDPASITLVAVSKGQPPAAIVAVRGLGVRDFGESYVQEAAGKMSELEANTLLQSGIQWHFIGRVQSNKTRSIAERFSWVHGVDRLAIARRLSEQRPFHAPPLNICLQVKLEEEPSKAGLSPLEVAGLAAEIGSVPKLKLRGLMCVPPPTADQTLQRSRFKRLRELFERLNASGLQLDTLSMGMSGDFETAIEEGATHVRIGTAIFGERT